MMRSMFSGVSGLRAHQTRMDVIGNNVANVNTVAFKSGRVTFSQVFSQTMRGASAPDSTTGRGGTNPMQVGLGLGVGTVDTLTTQGSTERTDNPTDMSIDGEGYFIAKGGSSGAYVFTRAGNFSIDKLGNLVTGSGLNVYGWQKLAKGATDQFDTESPVEPLNLYSDNYRNKRIIPAAVTTKAVLAGNLDASYGIAPPSTDKFSVPMTIYDSQGNPYKISMDFTKKSVDATGTTWNVTPNAGTSGATLPAAPFTIEFDQNGVLTPTSAAATYTLGVTFLATSGKNSFNVDLNIKNLTMYASDSSVKPTDIDGYPMGNLVTFNVGSDGILTGIYDNGQQQALGQVALATFENPAGLQSTGDNMYMTTTNSGEFKKGVKPGTDGSGTLNPGTLEMSNVDLSKEFTDMIITERGFQANSRIITTSDEMLQDLVNLKR